MTRKSRTVSGHELQNAQIIAANHVACKSIAEVRLTIKSALKIGAQRRKFLKETGNLTYSCSVNPVMLKRAVEKLLLERKLEELKSEWGR